MSSHLRLNSRLVPILVGTLVILQVFNPSTSWKVMLAIVGGAWLVGWFWARGLAAGLRLTREIRYGWAQVGDELEERFTIMNASFFPATWVEIDDFSTLPDYHASLVTSVGANSSNEQTTRGTCSRRGLYILGGASLQSGDPLGIYTVKIDCPISQTLLVLPPVVPLPSIDVTPGGFMGDGRPRSHSPELSVGAAGVREYQPGDPLRMIHWPTSARHNKTFVRLLDGTPAADWWILLDLDANSQAGQAPDSTEEFAIVLAASLADHGLRSRKAVGLTINGQQAGWLPPRANENQRWSMFRALALAQPGGLNLQHYLERSGKSFGRQFSLVIITANTSAAWLESLASLQWRGTVPTVMLLDPLDFGGAGNASGLSAQLERMSIRCHIIPHDLLDAPEAHPGHAGRWAWRTSATGKAIPISKPQDTEWRKL
jgi:uncharacterized protein (DUF58 family)